MKQCIGQLKFEECMTLKEKMEAKERHITKTIIYGSS